MGAPMYLDSSILDVGFSRFTKENGLNNGSMKPVYRDFCYFFLQICQLTFFSYPECYELLDCRPPLLGHSMLLSNPVLDEQQGHVQRLEEIFFRRKIRGYPENQDLMENIRFNNSKPPQPSATCTKLETRARDKL